MVMVHGFFFLIHAATGDEATVHVPRTCRFEAKADQSNFDSVRSCAASRERHEKACRNQRGKHHFVKNAFRLHAAAFARAPVRARFSGAPHAKHKKRGLPGQL